MTLALFHSGESHVATFTRLIGEMAPEIPLRHRVREDLLRAAQGPERLTDAIRREVVTEILALAEAGAAVVMCTCSTLGPGAEGAAERTARPVLRVDRPMMEAALGRGRRIAVAAALASTLGPTRDLLARVAAARGVVPEVREILVADAWPLFEAGDRAGYARAVAEGLRREVGGVDAVVLAQASMAPAAELLADLEVPILASPRLGAAAAVAAWREAVGRG